MADILYTYHNQAYANITNRCNCNCRFCIRSHGNAVGEAESLWLKKDPSLADVKEAMDHFGLDRYQELVYCGYGEPTCALDVLLESARYAKEKYGVSIRINTNGLANLYHRKNIIPLLKGVVDALSISLNAPTPEKYNDVARPQHDHAFETMLDFAREAKKYIPIVKLSVVDIISAEDIMACQELADSLGLPLRIRKYS